MWDTCKPQECVICLFSLFLLLEVDREHACLAMSGSDDSVARPERNLLFSVCGPNTVAQGDLPSWLQGEFAINSTLPLQPRKLYSAQEVKPPSHT